LDERRRSVHAPDEWFWRGGCISEMRTQMKETSMQTRPEEGSLKELREELDGLRGKIKLKLHLASLDARKEFSELEAKAKELQRELEQTGRRTSRSLLADATALVRSLRGFLDDKLGKPRASPH
jgi:chromosome segregation ATPase